jgi:formylglycine-generating enzyme required for sulfatase activity
MDSLAALEWRIKQLKRRRRALRDLSVILTRQDPESMREFAAELRAQKSIDGEELALVLAEILSPPQPGPRPTQPERHIEAQAAEPIPAPAPSAAESALAPAGSREGKIALLDKISADLVAIPAGSFVMGSAEGADNEKPPHRVSLSAFKLSKHLVTNAEYQAFVRENPAWAKDRAATDLHDGHYLADWEGDQYPEEAGAIPVSGIPFYAAQAFAAWIGLRLPSEAEWEYAARGGLAGKKYPNGQEMNDKLANFAKRSKGAIAGGNFPANGYGLFDMAGNLFQWTNDWYGSYSAAEESNPTGPGAGEYKVIRGGSWVSGAGALRVSFRVDEDPTRCAYIGFRLAL